VSLETEDARAPVSRLFLSAGSSYAGRTLGGQRCHDPIPQLRLAVACPAAVAAAFSGADGYVEPVGLGQSTDPVDRQCASKAKG
jgi:hypothetical protein